MLGHLHLVVPPLCLVDQERGRYLVSPAPVSSASSSNLPPSKPRTESAEVSRSITVSRSMERSKSARSAHSPSPSPGSSPKSIHIYRADSTNSVKPSAAKSGSTKGPLAKGTEISRPRIPSRSASAHEDTSDSAKPPPKLVTIPIAPKGAYRPHKLKLKLSGHMVRRLSLSLLPMCSLVGVNLSSCYASNRTASDRLHSILPNQFWCQEARTALSECGTCRACQMARHRSGKHRWSERARIWNTCLTCAAVAYLQQGDRDGRNVDCSDTFR